MVNGGKGMGMVSDREARGESSYVPTVTQLMRKKLNHLFFSHMDFR